MMVGRSLDEKYPKRNVSMGEEVLRVENLTGAVFDDISFSLRKGELLGIFGLVGAGRTEMVRALYGADRKISGKVFLQGKEIKIRKPIDAISKGIVLLTENRKEEGLILIHDVVENTTLPTIDSFRNRISLLRNKDRYAATMEYGRDVNLRPLHVRKHTMNFSGGNQQKIVVEKWLMSDAKVYIFDEPTKGVDVGAKTEIYAIMNRLLESGASIIMVSSEMQEIIGMSDTIMLMYEGESKGIFENGADITHEKIMTMITGGK
jgi:ribose transport system ATP-binding protein